MWKSCLVASFVFFFLVAEMAFNSGGGGDFTTATEQLAAQPAPSQYSLIALCGKVRESVQCPDLPTTGTHQRIPEHRVCVSLLPHSGHVARSALFHISCQISTFYRFYLTGLSGAETLLVCSVTAYNSQMNKK